MSDRRGGYTIVEVLVSMMVLSFGILSLASTAGGITNMMYTGQRKTKSYAMAASGLAPVPNPAKLTPPHTPPPRVARRGGRGAAGRGGGVAGGGESAGGGGRPAGRGGSGVGGGWGGGPRR